MTLQSIDAPASGSPSGAVLLRRFAASTRSFGARYGVLAAFLIFWQVSATVGWVNPSIFPPLDKIAAALWTGIAGGSLLDDIAISHERAGIAFFSAVALGIPLGLMMGQFRTVERALDPILQLFRQTSRPIFIKHKCIIISGNSLRHGIAAREIPWPWPQNYGKRAFSLKGR